MAGIVFQFANSLRYALPLVALAALAPALVGEQVHVQIEPNLPLGDDSGVCIFRVRVDGSADLMLTNDRLTLRAIAGKEPVDEGTVCNAPLPELPLRSFRMEQIRGRGRALLVENPAGRNAFQAWVRINDPEAGDDLYELRVSWRFEESGPNGRRNEIILRPAGTPMRWMPEGTSGSRSDLPGTRLTSYDNDPLRYESSRTGQLEFRGRVDGVTEFYVRGDNLHADLKSGQPVKVERFRFTQPLPGLPLSSILLEKKDGRGAVELIQRPSQENDYTVVIRVSDTQGGSDRYHWVLTWSR